jgi:hypothetical protein
MMNIVNQCYSFRQVFHTAFAVSVLVAFPTLAFSQEMIYTKREDGSILAIPANWRALEDSILSPDFWARGNALYYLSSIPDSLSQQARTDVIELLRREMNGGYNLPPPEEVAPEEFGEYWRDLLTVVERLNDPRATPLLTKVGIAFSQSSRFQIAAAGDDALDELLSRWEYEDLRVGLINTLGLLLEYADSTGQSLSKESRLKIREHLLRAYDAPEPWVRHAFIDAVEAAMDPSYLPLLHDIVQNDPAELDGRRYVARDAEELVPSLEAERNEWSATRLISALQESVEASCDAGWIDNPRVCRSLAVKVEQAARSLQQGRGQSTKGQLRGFLNELEAQYGSQPGKHVSENAYWLLRTNSEYLLTRIP